jgi:hypothetical protein
MGKMTWHRQNDEELMNVLDTVTADSAAHRGIILEYQRRAAEDSIKTSTHLKSTAFYTGLIALFTFLTALASVLMPLLQK